MIKKKKKKLSKIGRTAGHALDESIFHKDVSVERLIVVDNLPSFNDETVALQAQKRRETSRGEIK